MSALEIQTGQPTVEGRYVIYTPSVTPGWCEPSIAAFHGGRWHSYDLPLGWVGPLPVVHQNDCLKKMREYDL